MTYDRFGELNVTVGLIAVTCLLSWLAWRSAALQRRMIFWPPAIARGRQVDRLLTHGFIHADGQHLLFNMLTLWFFGPTVEALFDGLLGGSAFLGFYLAAVVVAILPTYARHRHDQQYFSLGASGAVSAVLFAYIVLRPWATIFVFVLPLPAIVYAVLYVIYSARMNRAGRGNVNHSAHLAGAAFGIAFTLVTVPGAWDALLHNLANPRFRW